LGCELLDVSELNVAQRLGPDSIYTQKMMWRAKAERTDNEQVKCATQQITTTTTTTTIE